MGGGTFFGVTIGRKIAMDKARKNIMAVLGREGELEPKKNRLTRLNSL